MAGLKENQRNKALFCAPVTLKGMEREAKAHSISSHLLSKEGLVKGKPCGLSNTGLNELLMSHRDWLSLTLISEDKPRESPWNKLLGIARHRSFHVTCWKGSSY